MWKEENNKLVKTFEFKDFKEAFAFMTKVALLSEQLGHHPNWSNAYNKVSFYLATHDAGNKVTERDHTLAKKIDELAS